MSIIWKVAGVVTSNDPAPDTVVFVRLEARDGEFVEGCEVKLGPPGQPFTPFNDLTEAQVLAWALETAPVARVTENLAAQADRAATQPKRPPWDVDPPPPEPEPEPEVTP